MNLDINKADTPKILCPQQGFFGYFMKLCIVLTFKLTNSLVLLSIRYFLLLKCLLLFCW